METPGISLRARAVSMTWSRYSALQGPAMTKGWGRDAIQSVSSLTLVHCVILNLSITDLYRPIINSFAKVWSREAKVAGHMGLQRV